MNWTRSRVVNFNAGFALPYVGLLVDLDGQPYEQAQYFKHLVDAGIVKDVDQEKSETEIVALRAKRWDSYLGKIREFGLGFAVDETRKGGQSKRSFWKASDVAKDLASGRLNFRQFMALQLTRFQLPRPSMPLQPGPRTEIQQGVKVRPLKLILQTLDQLEQRNALVYLSREEILRHLTGVENHDDEDQVVEAIMCGRSNPKDATNEGPIESQPTLDIWLNEFSATGYLEQLRPGKESGLPAHIIVRGLSRFEEARMLDGVIPLQEYDVDEETINTYYDFLCSSPSKKEREILMMDPRVVKLEVPTEAQYSLEGGTLTGPPDTVGSLQLGSLVVLAGNGLDYPGNSAVFEVYQRDPSPSSPDATVSLRPVLLRMDGLPVVSG